MTTISPGTWNTCCKCKSAMWIPEELQNSAMRARGQIPFYCAYGHRQFYIAGETEEQKLRRERDRFAQQIAERNDEIALQRAMRELAERQAAAARGQITKLKKRASAGICPCCNRSFLALRKHMTQKHPAFVAESSANVVSIKKTA